jgi:hypothetical protein
VEREECRMKLGTKMRKRTLATGAVLSGLLAAAVVGHAVAQVTSDDHGEAGPTTEATGEAREVIRQIRDYRSWSQFPGQPVFSRGHDGTYVVGYYNETAASAVGREGATFPEGSIIVKENRPERDADPAALTTMAKRGDGWYWLKSTPDGRVSVSDGQPLAGKVDMCIGCHSQAPADMVFSGHGSQRNRDRERNRTK